MQIMIMHFVCHFTLNNKICGFVTKKLKMLIHSIFQPLLNLKQKVSAEIFYQNLLQHLINQIISYQSWSKLLKVTSATKRKKLKISNLSHSLRSFHFVENLCSVFKIPFWKTILWFAKSVTSYWVLLHETECIF